MVINRDYIQSFGCQYHMIRLSLGININKGKALIKLEIHGPPQNIRKINARQDSGQAVLLPDAVKRTT